MNTFHVLADLTINMIITSIEEQDIEFKIDIDLHGDILHLTNDNGLYIIGDTICYKDYVYIDNNYPNHLDYFSKYIKFLNQWRNDSTEGIKDNCIDPFKIQKKLIIFLNIQLIKLNLDVLILLLKN